MNKHLYRIIFNARRGCRMVVAETASAQGKSTKGETRGASGRSNANNTFTMTVGASVLAVIGLCSMPLNAQIIADRTAPGNQQPTVLTTASGVTQVNIQTPSAAGVSRNTYSQFDVNSKGAILNNSRIDTNTQIGGYVQANPWLATGGARVILNEVNSANPSQLKGYVEVAGQRAEVIIANPAGIAVNGGGFLNASAVTLTTGTAVMNAGSLDSFKVRGGAVTIDGAGLDTSTADYTNILARAAQVNAGIWAKDLKVVTGANDISVSSADNPSVTATTSGAGATHAFALDVAQLGGMYAGKIFLIGTEAGVGVRNSGVVGATAGDVVLTANGILTHSGSIYASGNTSITTQGDINTSGSIAAQGNTTLNAQGTNTQGQASQVHATSASVTAAGVDSSGAIGSTGNLQISSAGSSALHGQVVSGADSTVTGASMDISGASINTHGTLRAQAQTALTTDGATVNAAQLALSAHDLSNVGGKLLQSGTGDMAVNLPGNLNNTGGTIASNAQNITLGAATLTNTGGTISHAGAGTLGLTVQELNGNAGTIVSNGALAFNATGAVNLQGATTAAQSASIQAASMDNSGGHLQTNGPPNAGLLTVTTTGAFVNNAGSVFSAGDVNIHAGSLSNDSTASVNGSPTTAAASIYATGNATLNVAGTLQNSGTVGNTASIAAQGDTSINAQSVVSNANSLLAGGMQASGSMVSNPGNGAGNLTVSSTGTTQALGQNLAALAATLSGSSVDLSNSQTGAANVRLTANSGDIGTQGASIVTSGTLSVVAQANAQQTWNNSAPGINTGAAPVIQAGQLEVSVANLNNQGANIVQTGTGVANIKLTSAQGTLNNSAGSIAANATDLTLGAAVINNTGGAIRHAGTGTLTVNTGTFSGSGGTTVSNGALNLNASGAVDLHNATTSAVQVSLAAASLENQNGRIVQTGATIPAASIAVTGALDNTGGFMGSNGGLQVSAGSVTNANGQLVALQSLGITSSGAVNNSAPANTVAGLIQSNGALTIQAASLDNTGATVSSAQGSVAITTSGQTTNTAGKITAGGDTTLTSASLLNGSSGLIGANGAVNLNSDTIQNGGGQIVGAGNVTIAGKSGAASAATLLDNTAGLVQSGATLTVNASQIINTATYTAPAAHTTALGLVGQDVQIAANSLNNQGGEVLAGNNLTVTATQSIDNSTRNSQGGLLYAGRVLRVQDSALVSNPAASRALQVANTGGTLNAGSSNQLSAAGVSGDGQLLSQGDLSLDVSGDFNNTGTVNANGNTSITSSGTVNNSGTLSSGQTLSVAAVNLNNTVSGILSGASGTNVVLSNALTNRGLIDSGNNAGTSLTLIKAQAVNNIGTGRIYGDNIAIAANTLTNDAETVSGVTKTAVIAARNTLDMGVQTINNSNGSTVLSLGDMAIGGGLDANNRATGAATTITNSASTIQSVNGNVTINTATLQNLNPNFSYQVVSGTPTAEKTEYILTNGQTVKDTDVALDNGLLHTYEIAGGNTSPYGKVLLASDPLATASNIAVYQEPDVVTYTQVQIGTGGGHNGDNPIYETRTSVAAPQNSQVWALVGMTAPTDPPPTGDRPPETITTNCGGHNGGCITEHNPAVDVWDAAAAPYLALQSKIDAMRSTLNANMVTVQAYSAFTETAQQAVVSGGTPATITSGGNITINATSSARNDNSRIIAGGALAVNVTGGQLDNTSTNVTVHTDRSGYNFNWECVNVRGASVCGVAYYNQFNLYNQPNLRENPFTQSVPTTVQVSNSQVLQYTNTPSPSAQAAAATGGGGVQGANLLAKVSFNVEPSANAAQGGDAAVGSTSNPLASKTAATSAQASSNAANHIATTTLNFKLPNSSLYQINTSPSAHYLVQTDPAFTNYRAWLSSDYISSQIALDPTVTQKRLGDGFYEQQLIREQVAQLTGQRFLGNYTSDQQQYQALMDSGLTFAKAYNLREGVALTAAQVALLTSDIVWLEQQTVTLPDGTTTQALVPHVYAAIRDGDLAPSGALLAGSTVSIQTSGDVNNTGTIAGRTLVQISGYDINNTVGSISSQNVSLNAVRDINNIGGAIVADSNLLLGAGRDITVASTTQSSSGSGGNYSFSQSGIDRVATLYTRGPGVLLASAGNNINFTGAQVSSGGDAQIAAGNNLTLSTVTTSRSDNVNAGIADNHFNSSSSKEVGTTIKSAGNTSLSAGNTLSATAAQVVATGDLGVNAQNVVLLAGQSKASSDSVMTNTSGDWLSSTTTVTKESHASAQAQVSSLSGNSVTITADQDLVSVGTQFAANDTLTVEGKNSQTFYAAKDQSTSSKSVDSSSSMFGGAISMGSSSTSDTSQKSISIGSELQSNNAINVKVGNSATFEGADITAKTTTFTKTDPNKAGQLNLNGSVDTTETTHTEKSDSLGVYQSQSGNGSTTQTLNLTKINGSVAIDQNLAVAVQLPKVVNTSGDKANTAAAANQTNTASQASVQAQIDELSKQPGLGYLSQLSSNAAAANPTQWSQVQLAHDNWSYESQGLTPAGAALLSIAVAAYTGGMGAEMLGGTSATAATATTAASSATLMGSTALGAAANAGFASLASQAAVAMVNNGGDIGKTLEQLGSEQSIKGLLTTMVTAGALDKLNSTLFNDTNSTSFNGQTGASAAGSAGITTTQTATNFSQNLLKNVTNNLAGSAIDAAINGKPFDEKALSSALSSALITTGMASGANGIGEAKLDTFTSSVAHAALGCVGGAAIAGNGSGCSAGAVGAMIGELTANYALNSGMSDTQAAALAKVLSAAAGILVGGGGDNVAAVNIASTTGANAAENNRILHMTESQKAAQLASLSGGKYTQAQIEDAMRNSGNKVLNETVATGMVNPGTTVEDKGAVFNVGGDGTSVVQTLPNGGKVDPALAAYIIANTGGANSPYSWLDVQTGKVTPTSNPNAGLNTITPNANGCVTAECAAGISADMAKLPNGNYGVGFYPGLAPGGEIEIEVQDGSIVGGKVGAGFGVGGHINLGTKTVGAELLQGPVSGAKGGALYESNPQQAGEVRIGPAASVNVGGGTIGLETGYATGASISGTGLGGYENVTITPTVAPVLPKISAEAKVNIIEFSVKPSVQLNTSIPEVGSK